MTEELSKQEHFTINSVTSVLSAWRYGLETALTMGFPYPEAYKIAAVISELGWNIKRVVRRAARLISMRFAIQSALAPPTFAHAHRMAILAPY